MLCLGATFAEKRYLHSPGTDNKEPLREKKAYGKFDPPQAHVFDVHSQQINSVRINTPSPTPSPPLTTTDNARIQPRTGDRFGESLSVYGNFLVVGCPQREETWLHTGTEATDWEGEDVGAVYVYRRDSAEGAFSFFQVKMDTYQVAHRGTASSNTVLSCGMFWGHL